MVVKKATGGISTRFPESLSLSDLISIVSVAVSIALAWGYFGARVTALEKEVISIKDTNEKQAARLDGIEGKLGDVTSTAHDSELYIDQLFKMLKQSQPRHRSADRESEDYTPNYSVTPDAKQYLNRR